MFYPYQKKMSELPGQPDWVIGVFNHMGKNVKVIDTGRLVMPESARNYDIEYKQVVIIHGGEWGLACCDVSDVFSLQHSDVRWRLHNSSRQWLAGTLIEKMSGLLDVSKFIQYLENKLN